MFVLYHISCVISILRWFFFLMIRNLDGNRIQHVDDDAFSHLWQLEDM